MDLGGNDTFIANHICQNLDVFGVVIDNDPQSLENSDGSHLDDPQVAIYRGEFFDSMNPRTAGASDFASLLGRIGPSVVLCHAVLHHITITQAVPLSESLRALRSLNVPVQMEFVDENDPKTRQLIRNIRMWNGRYSRSEFEDIAKREFSFVGLQNHTIDTRAMYELVP